MRQFLLCVMILLAGCGASEASSPAPTTTGTSAPAPTTTTSTPAAGHAPLAPATSDPRGPDRDVTPTDNLVDCYDFAYVCTLDGGEPILTACDVVQEGYEEWNDMRPETFERFTAACDAAGGPPAPETTTTTEVPGWIA